MDPIKQTPALISNVKYMDLFLLNLVLNFHTLNIKHIVNFITIFAVHSTRTQRDYFHVNETKYSASVELFCAQWVHCNKRYKSHDKYMQLAV